MFYSPSNNGFYPSDPGDGYEISPERHAELLKGQGEGKTICAQSDGKPYLKSPAPLTQDQEIEINRINRQLAYRAESDPLYMEWQFDQTPESETAWRESVMSIKARFPIPS